MKIAISLALAMFTAAAADAPFEVVPLKASDAATVEQACTKIDWFQNRTLPSCYPAGWQEWVKAERKRIAPKELLTGDLELPTSGFLRFPDGSRHLVFMSTKKSVNVNSAYWLVDVRGKRLNLVWVRTSAAKTQVDCFGPDAALLKKADIADMLDDAVLQ